MQAEIIQLYSRGLPEFVGSCALPACHADRVSKVSKVHIAHWHWSVLSYCAMLPLRVLCRLRLELDTLRQAMKSA